MYTVRNKSILCDIFYNKDQAETYLNTRHLRHNYSLVNTLERITEGQYYYLLESLPPVFVIGFVFANSEPVTHFLRNNRFTPVYNVCFQKNGYYFKFLSALEDIVTFHPSDLDVSHLI